MAPLGQGVMQGAVTATCHSEASLTMESFLMLSN